ncbi:MAG: recombinase RecA [Candidatus Riflebacteria bacterium]|nr:recombinase RecA [Candidatus Riflebacteria bacterium]
MIEKQSNTERMKSLETAISSIEKQFGKGAVMRLGSSRHLQVDSIPTGSLSLDYALGVGGMPRGRIIEIYGPESSGKTTIALHSVAQAQKAGGTAAFVDVEHALDPSYARKLGVDTENLLIAQPSSGEEALEITEMLVRSNAIDIIILDSVAALTSKAEIDGDMGDATVGMQARLMSQAMRKLTPVVSKSKCVCIFINQIREKIGVMFGNPETTPGGRALKFFSSVRLDIRRKDQIKEGDEPIGYVTEVKVVKNKVAPPFKKARFDMMFGSGISTEGEVLEIAENANIVNKSGAWYSYGDIRIGQGRENAKIFMRENPDVFAEIVLKVKKSLGMITDSPAEAKASPAEDKKKTATKK